MEAIIDKSYFFKGETFIAGLNKTDPENEDELIGYINQYQDEFFNRVFGNTLTDEQKALLVPYIVDDVKKKSPFANYIYCIYMENNASYTTDSGVKGLATANTTVEDWRKKAVRAWNNMTIMLQDVHNVLYELGTIGSINYLNDIETNVSALVCDYVRSNGTIGVYLKGGIFKQKSIYDYQR